ncbi:putative mitogen-activated protein kinase kinase 3 [Leptomonas pyrrhocoris]|uniref:Putative mitogen-activated protein kinase kinase 3 n=1 Tax=Leptomonas pyrrhocoris TaxID=157538 RepID=A0A0M9FP88_LEPPY|nr:putative mitogen-activated protein kinase kinase 3 [Leptomonas pyrrhocoris]KPA73119.1 putative mitogen-activated protein kinase kinase 3 [Leptomonas pyrrhocoris]|eukprot:XP_015651558.1 putative mitogen-activated protein kinase kinase 3 [Leptomonas pyrrhocoris]
MDFYALQDSLQRGAHVGYSSDLVPIESRYAFLDKIGSGSYGDVWRTTRRNGSKDLYAVKRIDKRAAGTKGLRSVMGEVETMSLLSHPNIVKLEETYQDDAYLWIVMEYLPGDSLQHRLDRERVSEAEARRFVTQLLMAVEYIHDKGIVHRDLKPSNCLLSQNDLVVKISDFGLSVLAGNEQCLTTRCGTLHYMAPEILRDTHYGKPVDMWAMGVMAHVMFLGEYPFKGRTESALSREICRGYRPQDDNTHGSSSTAPKCPPLLQDFIHRLLTSDPHRRMTATEALKHPWVKAGMELSQQASLSTAHMSSASFSRLAERWRAAVLAVIAAQRLLYFYKVKRLDKLGYGDFPILRDHHYLVTGQYEPPGDSLNCSNMFHTRPMALLELVAMINTCTYLRHVDFSWNNIRSLSVIQAFLKVTMKHPSLRSIDLSHNPIPAVAGRALVRLARNPLSHVTTINVGDTGIRAETISQINSFLKEKLAPPALSHSSSVADLTSRSTSQSPGDSIFSSNSTAYGFRQKRGALQVVPRRSDGRNSRIPRLPPIARLPPVRHSDKTS